MKYRKLRIAWSAACGILCLLLIVLWVRGYWWRDSVAGGFSNTLFLLDSLHGEFSLTAFSRPSDVPAPRRWNAGSHPADDRETVVYPHNRRQSASIIGLRWSLASNGFAFVIPYWFPAVSVTLLAAIPWMRWRFSLRTLLIGMTLLAVGLGVAVMMSRGS